ncbi:unnamed protein product [Adineta ricciae]|uniref:Uncharacterized protein n=1 Tax=Adineta ricciae TaxID=249248 RepID=A0A813W589_ADIRI|nr:unnamed protein product [Adineta ricciae]CAF0850995.1 unnamed protein product [Adineta ricciae]
MLSAPNVDLSDEQTAEITYSAQMNCLGDYPYKRRRYALIIFPNSVFIIGGYDFDATNKTRSQPLHDFIYDINKKECQPIVSFPPPGRVAFGVAPSERYIIVIGGQTQIKVGFELKIVCWISVNFSVGWEKFPSYPHPVLAPGVTFTENQVIVIGGFDIVVGETDMLSSHYQMNFQEKVWHRHADLNPARARTLVICIYNGDDLEIYTAGGYMLMNGKAQAIDKIHAYDAKKDQWNKLTDIPDLRMDHAITVAQTKLIISEEMPNLDEPVHPIMNPIRMYDFESGVWKKIENEDNQIVQD